MIIKGFGVSRNFALELLMLRKRQPFLIGLPRTPGRYEIARRVGRRDPDNS